MNVFDRGFYDSGELEEMGFKSVGINVSVSKMCSIFGCKNISFGDNCRIDDFAVINAESGYLKLGMYVHVLPIQLLSLALALLLAIFLECHMVQNFTALAKASLGMASLIQLCQRSCASMKLGR